MPQTASPRRLPSDTAVKSLRLTVNAESGRNWNQAAPLSLGKPRGARRATPRVAVDQLR
jgi:hypothetical protein